MRVIVAAVGRARSGREGALYSDYVARLPWPVDLHEIEIRRRLDGEARRAEEARLLLRVVPEDAVVVALDGRGRALSSEDFARQLARWRDESRPLAFLIGGADGHGEAVRERADLLLSLGAMTWPHLLVRAMLAEQLYRAATILGGHPYHRR